MWHWSSKNWYEVVSCRYLCALFLIVAKWMIVCMVSLILQDSKSYLCMILQSRLKIQYKNNCLPMAPMEWCPNKHRYLQCLLVCQELITKEINEFIKYPNFAFISKHIPPQHINGTNGDVHRNLIFLCLIYDVGTQLKVTWKLWSALSITSHGCNWLNNVTYLCDQGRKCYLLCQMKIIQGFFAEDKKDNVSTRTKSYRFCICKKVI